MVVHAGLAPEWTVDESITLGNELSAILRGPRSPISCVPCTVIGRTGDSNLEGRIERDLSQMP